LQSERGTWYVRRVDTLHKNVRFPQLEVKLRVTYPQGCLSSPPSPEIFRRPRISAASEALQSRLLTYPTQLHPRLAKYSRAHPCGPKPSLLVKYTYHVSAPSLWPSLQFRRSGEAVKHRLFCFECCPRDFVRCGIQSADSIRRSYPAQLPDTAPVLFRGGSGGQVTTILRALVIIRVPRYG
jgi:hypothetical protein